MEDEYVEPLNYAHVCPVLFTVSYSDSRGEKKPELRKIDEFM